MNIKLQRKLAKEAGKSPTGETWKSQYDYHLGVIDPPLMFGSFKTKFILLDAEYKKHPDNFTATMERLTNELGY